MVLGKWREVRLSCRGRPWTQRLGSSRLEPDYKRFSQGFWTLNTSSWSAAVPFDGAHFQVRFISCIPVDRVFNKSVRVRSFFVRMPRQLHLQSLEIDLPANSDVLASNVHERLIRFLRAGALMYSAASRHSHFCLRDSHR